MDESRSSSPLIPDYGDLEQAREAEVRSLSSPPPAATWRRWAAVAVLALVGGAMFTMALLLSDSIPATGNAAAEARVGAFVMVGATASGAAVTLAAVVLTLNLQREEEQLQRWAEFQRQVLRDAYDWVEGVYASFGEVLGAMQEWGYAIEEDKDQKLAHATRVAQRFYDQGQRLSEVERLERLIANREVRAALRSADSALRTWNEVAAPDHTTRAVAIEEVRGAQWDTYGSLGAARDHIIDAYAEAVRDALVPGQ